MFNIYCFYLYVIFKKLQCCLLTNGSSFYDMSLTGLRVMRKTSSRQSLLVYDLTYSNVDCRFDSELSMNKSNNALHVCFMKFNVDIAIIINFVHDAVLAE